jgi:GntR family transcriptional regulator
VIDLAKEIGPLEALGRAPLYQRLQTALRDAIHSETLKPAEALPPERDLAVSLEVSRMTVRKALDGLVAEGLLTRKQGAGTFVAGRVEKQFAKLTSFSEDMASRGRVARSEWISKLDSAVTPDEALTLGLSPGSRIFRFARIRFADQMAMALEYSTISGFALESADAVGSSLYEALDQAGHRPVRALQRLRAIAFDQEQARMLDVEAGDPGLFIERRGYLEDGRAVEMTHSYYRGDAYDFVAELNALS